MIRESGHLIIILLHPLAGSILLIFQCKRAIFPISLFRRGGKKPSLVLLNFFFWGVVMLSIFRLKELEDCQMLYLKMLSTQT